MAGEGIIRGEVVVVFVVVIYFRNGEKVVKMRGSLNRALSRFPVLIPGQRPVTERRLGEGDIRNSVSSKNGDAGYEGPINESQSKPDVRQQ